MDATDRQIIAHISTFPIPNTVEEISEFMFMVAGNINVNYSKARKHIWSASYEGTAEKAISDAWLSKMQQLYNKALMSFSDDPIFQQINQVYTTKMAELNLSVD